MAAKISSVADRIRGSIAIVLTITAFSIGANTGDRQIQAIAVVAGMGYMITSLYYVFKDVD